MKKQSILCLRSQGFTLIELLIVVIIISILASTAALSYTGRRKRAEYNTALAHVRSIVAAEKNYYLAMGAYWGTGGTSDTNSRLCVSVMETAFLNYRVSTSSAPFTVLVDNLGCTYTFNASGTRISTNGSSDCLP